MQPKKYYQISIVLLVLLLLYSIIIMPLHFFMGFFILVLPTLVALIIFILKKKISFYVAIAAALLHVLLMFPAVFALVRIALGDRSVGSSSAVLIPFLLGILLLFSVIKSRPIFGKMNWSNTAYYVILFVNTVVGLILLFVNTVVGSASRVLEFAASAFTDILPINSIFYWLIPAFTGIVDLLILRKLNIKKVKKIVLVINIIWALITIILFYLATIFVLYYVLLYPFIDGWFTGL